MKILHAPDVLFSPALVPIATLLLPVTAAADNAQSPNAILLVPVVSCLAAC